MSDTIRVGFVGCGLIARSHARGLAVVAGVEIGPVHDTDGARAADFARSAGKAAVPVDSVDDVIAGADAVYVCTWTAAHQAAVLAVADAAKPVFCEKPLAVNLAGAEEMLAAVQTADIINQVGLVLRHSPSFRWLRHHATDQPSVGPLMSVVFRDDQYLPTQGMYGSTWRADRTKAGAGTLLEHSIHDLDLLRWIMGPIDTISCHTEHVHGLDGIEDQAAVLVRAKGGATATLTSIWHQVLSRPSQRRVEAFCRDRLLTVSGDWSGPVTAEHPSGTIDELRGEALVHQAERLDGLTTSPDAEFIAAIRNDSAAYPDFSVAMEAHRLVDAAYRSAADDGATVQL